MSFLCNMIIMQEHSNKTVEFTPVAIAHNLRKWAKKAGLFWLLLKITYLYRRKQEYRNVLIQNFDKSTTEIVA
jgi:hypothetical protein